MSDAYRGCRARARPFGEAEANGIVVDGEHETEIGFVVYPMGKVVDETVIGTSVCDCSRP